MAKLPQSPAASPAASSVTPDLPLRHPLRSVALSSRKPTRFELSPDAATRAAIAQSLGLIEVPALHFKGEIRPMGAQDFVLEAELQAKAVQACAITLAPVPAKLRETVVRRYIRDWQDPQGDEIEMPEDDSAEALPEVIDIGAVAIEALVLALPLYPRAPGAELGRLDAAPPGAAPINDADLKPFAGLAALKGRLEGDDKT